MADKAPTHAKPDPELTLGLRLTRAAVGVLFYLILLIPRVRRLRRRVRVWTAIRLGAGLSGMALAWFFKSSGDWKLMAAALILMGLALVVRATPVQKSLEDRARELGALAVVNGGMMATTPGAPTDKVNIFAGSERLTVESVAGRTLADIPVPQIRSCRARATESGEGNPWELEIVWGATESQTAKFRFDGFFAEHLATVAATTIENLRRRELTVLK
jgi:hypothetical protein